MTGAFQTPVANPPPKREEDAADWHVRMTSGETFEVMNGVVRYSDDIVSIRAPYAGATPDALLFIAPTRNVDRVKRLTPKQEATQAA